MRYSRTPSRWRIALAAACGTLALLSGCATGPTHPSLVAARQDNTLPPLVPMRRFVANIDAVNGHVLSPDGQQRASAWSRS